MKHNFFLIFILIVPLAAAPYGGDSGTVLTIERCDTLSVTVTSDFPIDPGEYNLQGCTEVSENYWECECHDNYDLIIETQPNTLNDYEIQAEYTFSGNDKDGDGYPAPEDCDDNDDTVYPGAEELCDSKDNDCDGIKDEPQCGDETDMDCDNVNDCDDDECPGSVGQVDDNGCTAEQFCNNIIPGNSRSRINVYRCNHADWLNNEPDWVRWAWWWRMNEPEDCTVEWERQNRRWYPVCVALPGAD